MKKTVVCLVFLILQSCGNTDIAYLPLGSELKWEYRIEKTLNSEKTIGRSIVAELEQIEYEGERYYPFRNANGEMVFYSQSDFGVSISDYPGNNNKLIFNYPLETGSEWQQQTVIEILDSRHESFSGGESFISLEEIILLDKRIVSLEDVVDVPAGKFKNCMRIESSASVTVKERTRGIDRIVIEQMEWYAKGVGLIKRIRKEYSAPEKYLGEQITELIDVK